MEFLSLKRAGGLLHIALQTRMAGMRLADALVLLLR